MKIAMNKEAGIITVMDLEEPTMIEIRDSSGHIMKKATAVTPSFSMDCEKLKAGTYCCEAKCQTSTESLVFDKKEQAA
jgi:hypothetical protein